MLRLWDGVKEELPKGKAAKLTVRDDLTIPKNLEQALIPLRQL